MITDCVSGVKWRKKNPLHLKDMDSSESTVATCLQKCFLVINIIIIIIETRLNVFQHYCMSLWKKSQVIISPKASEL